MTTKDWYTYFLSKDLYENNTGTKKMCKIESKFPLWNWSLIWKRINLKGITNDQKSFIWRFIHDLLPTQERKATIHRYMSSKCTKCTSDSVDNILLHTYTVCEYSIEVIKWLMCILSYLDVGEDISEVITLRFSILNQRHELPCVWLIAETLQTAWTRRIADQSASLSIVIPIIKAHIIKLNKSEKMRPTATTLLAAFKRYDDSHVV